MAVEHGQLHIAKLLLEAGAHINAVHGPNDDTALMMAASSGNIDMVRFLLSQGAASSHMDYRGNTALINAGFAGSTKIIQSLIAYGADVNAQLPEYVGVEGNKTTAILAAARAGNEKAVKLLLANNADIHRTQHGQSIFELAKKSNNTSLNDFLLTYRNPKLDDMAYILSQIPMSESVKPFMENEITLEKRITGAFSKPHAQEELIILGLPNTYKEKKSGTKLVAVFDVKNAKFIASMTILAAHAELTLLPTKNNTNILLATYYTKDDKLKTYYAKAFQVHQESFMAFDAFTQIKHRLDKRNTFLYKYSDTTLEIFTINNKNETKTIQHFLTCKWSAKDASFHDIAHTTAPLHRFSENCQHLYSTWLLEGHWKEFEDMVYRKEEETRRTIKKLAPHFTPLQYSYYKLIEKDDATRIIAHIIPVVDEKTAKEQDDYMASNFYAIQTYFLREENGLEMLSMGEPLAIQQSNGVFFTEPSRKKMSIFLSNFSEIGMNHINIKEIIETKNMDALLNFGIYHNYVNNFKKRIIPCKKNCPHGDAKIHASHVQESLKKYFNYDLTKFTSTPLFHYDGTFYHFNIKKSKPVLYVRVEKAMKKPNGNIRMEGVLYNSAKKDERHSRIEAEAQAHTWEGKTTWAIITLSKKD